MQEIRKYDVVTRQLKIILGCFDLYLDFLFKHATARFDLVLITFQGKIEEKEEEGIWWSI
jgi:hypothetical protein